MARYLFLLAILFFFTCYTLADDSVYIPDTNLKAAIEAQLGISDPNTTDMLELTNLQSSNMNISDLTGLNYATNLKSLKLPENKISDISPLANLTNLQNLGLKKNQIDDISLLTGLTNLQWLDLKNNIIIDISPLMSLTNLNYLNLINNPLSHDSCFIYMPIIETNNPEIILYYNPWSPPVNFADANLKQAVEEQLCVINPTEAQMTTLTYLSANDKGITDINGIEYATNLQVLELGINQISDISPLKELINLEWLWLNDNQISDISSVAGLKNLQALGLDNNNNINDISPVEGLTNLHGLFIGGNNISDISPLSSLINLDSIGLSVNQIIDISPVAGLTNLQHLFLGANQISDISPLAELTNIETLDIAFNQISDLSPLFGLTNLQSLALGNNQIDNITALINLTNLQNLDLNHNQISNISPIAGLTNLQDLYLGNNQISDISSLDKLTNLQSLSLTSNYISDISPLEDLINLLFLELHVNQISNIYPLAQMTNLEFLGLNDNQISNISPLYGLTNLYDLHMVNNQITNISPLVDMKNLRWLELVKNQIIDISPISVLTNFIYLDVSANNLSWKSYDYYLPVIKINNPNAEILYDPPPSGVAPFPQPSNGATNVAKDIDLIWWPGIFADTYNVYWGTDYNDVNNATVDYPLGTTGYHDLTTNSIHLDNLAYNTTYYWRVDEVNSPPAPFMYKGQVWHFTVEPFAYKIPSEKITATAISSYRNKNPNSTIDESGLDQENMDLHSDDYFHMWYSSGNDTEPVWIKYEFDQSYKLYEMYVWNYNNSYLDNCGFRDVTVEYSQDDVNWTELPDIPEFAKAPIADGYQYNTTVDFGGILAKYVRLTANSNWSDSSIPNYGLSEVRFTYIPLQAREPFPAINANNVSNNVTLSWRPGREAAEHNFYLSSDFQDVNDSNIPLNTHTSTSYGPISLEPDCTYYWRVDEVNESATPSLWQGNIWGFTTSQYIVVDDSEDYNDIESHRIFDIWLDGRSDPENGSLIGYPYPNFNAGEHYLEMYIQHNGLWSIPIIFDNSTASYSEVTVNTNDLSIGSDWTIGWPETLVLWFYGDHGNPMTEQMYIKINNEKIFYNSNSDISIAEWKQWKINLTTLGIDLSCVTSFSIGLEKTDETGGSGIIFVDDIRLYRDDPKEEIWIEAEDADSITTPLMIYDDQESFGGQYFAVLSGYNSVNEPPYPDGTASYIFEVSGGTYRVQARCSYYVDQYNSDSCWIRINGATLNTTTFANGWIKWNNIELNDSWHWDIVHSTDDENKLVEFELDPGIFTLEIGYREDGLYLDAILITKI
ncbi:MAG: leucine-rich repeat domain-containing protein, partial [Sedimentisphaerales bacterium]|nr:leucine-rich repeat domain-containing protein [Sedimentisphaerales bacterium]